MSLSLVSFAFRSSSSPQSSLTPPPFPLFDISFSQTHLWGERLQLSAATPFKTEQLKMYASRGSESLSFVSFAFHSSPQSSLTCSSFPLLTDSLAPCVSLRYNPDPTASAEERASGERSFLLLTTSLSTKQIVSRVSSFPLSSFFPFFLYVR